MKLYDLSILFIVLVVGLMIYPVYTTVKDYNESKSPKEEHIEIPEDMPCSEYAKGNIA